jgi:hypothetical protein
MEQADMISASAAQVQKNFNEYEEKAGRDGRRPSYLVSEELFKDMISSYRKAIPVEALSDSVLALLEKAQVQTDEPYNLDDIPEIDDAPSPSF